MKYLVGFASLFVLQNICAEGVYTCTKNGVQTFQSTPCTKQDVKNFHERSMARERAKQEAIRKSESETRERANRKEPQIGMTEAEVLSSKWGEATSVNRTTTSSGISEQWVYRIGHSTPKYLYLKNGIVIAKQD